MAAIPAAAHGDLPFMMWRASHDHLERLERRLWAALLAWVHPELKHVDDVWDRWRIVMIASLPHRGRGWVMFGAMLIIELTAVLAGFIAARAVPGTGLAALLVLVLVSAVVFVVLTVALFAVDRLLSAADIRRVLAALDIPVCPVCGYNLHGHVDVADLRCPECGHALII